LDGSPAAPLLKHCFERRPGGVLMPSVLHLYTQASLVAFLLLHEQGNLQLNHANMVMVWDAAGGVGTATSNRLGL
jgi:hypothetical protein